MRKGNRPNIQQEINGKLHQIQSLIGECIDLAAQLQAVPSKPTKPSGRTRRLDTSVDFDLHQRAFMKRYAKNLSGGPKKFVAVLAYLAKGDSGKEVPLKEIQQLWNKMRSKSLLGMKYNGFFSTSAKDNGWVNSKKYGFYKLERSWKDIFAND